VRPVVTLKSGIRITGGTGTEDDPYTIGQTVNKPKLADGLTPVNWNGSTWVETSEANWNYNYDTATASQGTVAGDGTAMWANAKTADGSLYVWIPRYTYKITSGYREEVPSWNNDTYESGTYGKISVRFSDGTIDDTTNDYILHPAFTFGTENIEGFWVMKYEASKGENNTPKSLPSVAAWTNISMSSMYDYSYNMNRSLESHMMKNTEWGAVAYLTNALGRIPYNNNSAYITGIAADTLSAGYGDGSTNAWNTVKGVRGSTTHNVYGVYDMAGGVNEYVAAYLEGTSSTYGSGDVTNKAYLGSLYTNKDTKYVDLYTSAYDVSNIGDALYETSINAASDTSYSWDDDYSVPITSGAPGMMRGGRATNGEYAGIFSFHKAGSADTSRGFRVVMIP